jgi:hypothetical protein
LGTAAHPPELDKVRCDFAVVLDYDYLSCGLVGGDVHGGWVDACEGFDIATTSKSFK